MSCDGYITETSVNCIILICYCFVVGLTKSQTKQTNDVILTVNLLSMSTMNEWQACSSNHPGEKEIRAIMTCSGFDPDFLNSDGKSALHLAVECRLKDVVKELVSCGANVNQSDFRKVTPLIVAVRQGFTDIAEYLIKKGANVNHATSTGETPLYIACEKVNLEMVNILLENGSDVDSKTNEIHPRTGSTPFLASIPSPYEINVNKKKKSTMLTIMKLLMSRGCDVNVQNFSGNTALHLASDFGDVHTVCVLAESGADLHKRNKCGFTAFDNAVHPDTQRYDIATCLLLHGYRTEMTSLVNCQPAVLSIIKGVLCSEHFPEAIYGRQLLLDLTLKEMKLGWDTINEVTRLLNSAPSIMEKESALCKNYFSNSMPESLQKQCRRVIRKALDTRLLKGIEVLPVATAIKRFIALDFAYKERNPLQMCELLLAMTESDLALVKEALNVHEDIDLNFTILKHTPLTLAASLGCTDIFKCLLLHGARAELLDNQGSTALHEAASSGHIDLIQLMVHAGMDVNIKNKDGESALMKAAENGQFETLVYLLEHGCDCEMPNKDGYHAIHFTTASGSVPATRALLAHNVSSNQRDPHQNTPLHVAASLGMLYTSQNIDLRALFPSKAAMQLDSLRNAMGLKPSTKYFDDSKYGESINHAEVVMLLLKAGANTSALNTKHKYPVEVAKQFDSKDLLELLGNDIRDLTV